MAIRGADPPFGMEISADLVGLDRHASGQREFALAAQQTEARLVDGDQGGRAGGLHVDARAPQAQLVGDAGRQVVVVVRDRDLLPADRTDQVRVEQQVQYVGVLGRSGKDADPRTVIGGAVPGVLEGLPRAFEEHALLGIDDLGLARRVAEEAGVEQVRSVEGAARLDEAGVLDLRAEAGGAQLLVGEGPDRLHLAAQVAPELLDVPRSGEAARHADDGDALALDLHSFDRDRRRPLRRAGRAAPRASRAAARPLALRSFARAPRRLLLGGGFEPRGEGADRWVV